MTITRNHRKALSLALLGLAAVFALGLRSMQESVSRMVARAYVGDDGMKITGLGVCSVLPEQVRCWDMDGKDDQKLTERVRGHYASQHNDINLVFGKKNRFLIVKVQGTGYVQFTDGLDQYLQNSSIGPYESQHHDEILRMASEPSETEATIRVGLNDLSVPKPIDLPLKVGAKVDVLGSPLEIASIDSLKTRPMNYDLRGKIWKIVVGRPGATSSRVTMSYSVIGEGGAPIAHVSHDGRPVADKEFLREEPAAVNGYYNDRDASAKYFNAVIQGYGSSYTDAFVLYTNVNPSRVKSLRLTFGATKKIAITGFPLDPK